jgi:hypothetical protein
MTPDFATVLIAAIAALITCLIAGCWLTHAHLTDKRTNEVIEEARARDWGRG